MANSIRNVLTVFGPLDSSDRFVGRFLRGGMDAFVPAPERAVLSHELSDKWTEIWGACPEYGDFEVLTQTSIVAGKHDSCDRPQIRTIEANWMNNNTFTLENERKNILSKNLPGFVGSGMSPAAILVFYTKWRFPYKWIEAVINSEYSNGLVFHMRSYDIGNYGEAHGVHFHAYTSDGTEHIQSGHCAIVVMERAESCPPFDAWDDGDYDPTIPDVDSDLATAC